MAPNQKQIIPSGVLNELEAETSDGGLFKPASQEADDRKYVLVWRNVIIMSMLHVFFLSGFYMLLTGKPKWQTNVLGNKK